MKQLRTASSQQILICKYSTLQTKINIDIVDNELVLALASFTEREEREKMVLCYQHRHSHKALRP